jgi:ankyrin repeat protein
MVVLVLAGIALYQINEWWPGCNFVRGWYHSEPAGESLIVAAAKGGCTGCVRTLLNHGANPNVVNDVYVTPLVGAVQYGHYRTARLLLKAGANVNAGVGSGTALCQAVMSENRDDGSMTKLLVDYGANLKWTGDATQPDFNVFDCLHHSDVGPTPSEEARRFAQLIDRGLVNVFAKFPNHEQAELLRGLYDDEIKQLANHGAKLDLDVQDSHGKTIFALGPGVCNRVRLLVSEGAKYGSQDAEAVGNCMNMKR